MDFCVDAYSNQLHFDLAQPAQSIRPRAWQTSPDFISEKTKWEARLWKMERLPSSVELSAP
jgi:hypothetical protein